MPIGDGLLIPGTLLLPRSLRIPYYLLDRFTTDDAAPLESPRTCDIGTLTAVQIDGQMSVSAGKLNYPSQATAAWGDQGFYGAGQTRRAGLALMAKIKANTTMKSGGLAWKQAANVAINAAGGNRWNLLFGDGISSTPLLAGIGTGSGFSVADFVAGTEYEVAIVLQDTGALWLIKGGAFTNWTLLYVDETATPATVYPVFGNFNQDGTLEDFRVVYLGWPFRNNRLVTSELSGALVADATYSHEANCLVRFTVGTLPSAGTIEVAFRRQDTDNLWKVQISSSGALSLIERVGGTDTSRATAAGVVAAGHTVLIIADGTTVRGLSNDVARWVYTSATNFQSATAGRAVTLGTGGAASNLRTWPRTPTGLARRRLNRAR